MVVRTAEQALQSRATRVLVASDDANICNTVQQHGIEAMLTASTHPSGTDRLAEVANKLGLHADQVLVNVQGDEPLIDPEFINQVAQHLLGSPQAAIATCAAPIHLAQTLFNANAVKVVCDRQQQALYFSRAPIPWARDFMAANSGQLAPGLPALLHIGLYAYRANFLQAFPGLPQGPLEQFESLEQLRALENGYKIAVYISQSSPHPGVDTAEDLYRVRKEYANRL